MKIKKYALLLVIVVVISEQSNAQNFWKDVTLSAGFAMSEQDRRLFQYSSRIQVLSAENQHLDYDIGLFLEKPIVKSHFFEIKTGLGYSRFISRFSRPFDHHALGGSDLFLRALERYHIDKIIVPTSATIYFGKKRTIFVDSYAIPSIAFRKGLDDFRARQSKEGLDDFSRWKLEPYSLAFYSQ